MEPARRPGWLLTSALLLAACGPPLRGTERTVRPPPVLPLGRPASLWVVSAGEGLAALLAETLAERLGERLAAPVHPVRLARLEALRRAGDLGPASMVLLLRLRVRAEPWGPWHGERLEGGWGGPCDGHRCEEQPQPWPMQEGVLLRGALRVALHDGPSAAHLATFRVEREAGAEAVEVAEALLVRALGDAVMGAVAPGAVRDRVRWPRVRSRAARSLDSALRRGRFAEARRRAERLDGFEGPEGGRLALLAALAWMHDEGLPWAERRRRAEALLEEAWRRASADGALRRAVAEARVHLRRHARWAERHRRARRIARLHARLWAGRAPPPPPGYAEERPALP